VSRVAEERQGIGQDPPDCFDDHDDAGNYDGNPEGLPIRFQGMMVAVAPPFALPFKLAHDYPFFLLPELEAPDLLIAEPHPIA
jgi:hypothetical protein